MEKMNPRRGRRKRGGMAEKRKAALAAVSGDRSGISYDVSEKSLVEEQISQA